jgi:hypothetical protein
MENSIKKNGITNGIILGLIIILSSNVIYIIDLSLFTSQWVGIINLLLILAFGIYTSVINKKLLMGKMQYKEAFLSFILPVIVGLALSNLFSLLLLNYIDPEAKEIITEHMIKMINEMPSKNEISKAEVQNYINEIRTKDNFGVRVHVETFFTSVTIYSVIGLIVGLIFKTPTNKE